METKTASRKIVIVRKVWFFVLFCNRMATLPINLHANIRGKSTVPIPSPTLCRFERHRTCLFSTAVLPLAEMLYLSGKI